MFHHRFFAQIVLLFVVASCKPAPQNDNQAGLISARKPTVQATNYPLKYFAERIGGGLVEVRFLAPADEDPAFWTPSDADVNAFQQADIILMNGATYSKWADKVSLPTTKIVDTSAAFKGAFIETKSDVTHSHGPAGDHSHSGTAFTTWIDFSQAAMQAQAVRDALAKVLPKDLTVLDANLAKLNEDLRALDDRMKTVGQRMSNQPVVASHPVYQYFARRYGLQLQAVLWEPETVPDDKSLAELQGILGKHPAKWMIWEGEPAKESVSKIHALGLQSVVFAPCGNVPDQGDFITVMRDNISALERAFP